MWMHSEQLSSCRVPALFWACALFFIGTFYACSQSVKATLQPQRIVEGQSAVLTLEFENLNPGGSLQLPNMQGLTVQTGGRSQGTEILNGRQTVKYSYQFFVSADRPGEYTIPAFRFQVGNDVFATESRILTVAGQRTDTEIDPANPPAAFLRLETPKASVYLGEVFPVRIVLYFQSARDLQMAPFESDGFTFGADTKPTQLKDRVNGVSYNTLVMERSAKAIRTGELSLGPAECQLQIGTLIPANRRSRSIFGGFDNYSYSPAKLASNELKISVLPLPSENVPNSFNGAIGTFRMVTDITPRELIVGDPITLQVKIGGTGGIESIELPNQAGWEEFKQYPANSTVKMSDEMGLQGIKKFEKVLIVQSANIDEFPRFEFAYFDPDKKSYVTLVQESIALKVNTTADEFPEPAPIVSADGTKDQRLDDIVHIKPRMGDPPSATAGLFVLTPVGIGLNAVPFVLWIAAAIYRRRSEFLASNPEIAQRREKENAIQHNLNLLAKLAANGNGDEFMVTLFRVLQDRISLRLSVPSSGITEDIVDERLKDSVDAEVCSDLHALFAACHQYRYARDESFHDFESLREQLLRVMEGLKNV